MVLGKSTTPKIQQTLAPMCVANYREKRHGGSSATIPRMLSNLWEPAKSLLLSSMNLLFSPLSSLFTREA